MSTKRRSDRLKENPPRILAAPFEFTVALLVLVVMSSFGYQIVTEYSALPHIGIYQLPIWLLWTWISMGGLSGILIIIGLSLGLLRSRARSYETAGLYLAGAVWGSIFIAEFTYEPTGWYDWGQYACIIIGVVLRLTALTRYEHAVSRVLDELDSSDNGSEM